MTENSTCTVCNIETKGNYCSNCGQKLSRTEIKFADLISDSISSALDVEKSIFAVLLTIFVNPSKLVVNYWKGYKKYYPSPFKLLIYALAVAAIHLAYVDSEILGVTLQTSVVDTQIGFWIIVLPLLGLSSYLTYLRMKHSLTKHIISLIYVSGTFFILITVIGDLAMLISGFDLAQFSFMTFLTLVFLWNAQVFSKKKKWWVYILNGALQFSVLVGVAMIILLILMSVPGAVNFNPPAP